MATTKKRIKFNIDATMQLSLAIGLFVLATLLTSNGRFPAWEEAIFLTIYGLPAFVGPYMIAITQLGNVFVLFGIAFFYLLKEKYSVMLRLLLSGSLAYLLSGVAKDLVGRARPQDFINDLAIRDLVVRGPGYPSGHAALATALVLTIAPQLPRKHRWWIVTIVIGGVGLSRIYLGVHAPLDVVGGIAIGWAAAELFRHVEIRDKFHKPTPRKHNQKALKSAK